MKFCIYCGQKLEEGVKFCPSCGTRLAAPVAAEEPAPVQEAPVYEEVVPAVDPAPEQTVEVTKPAPAAPRKKKSKRPAALGIVAVAAVVVIALVVMIASGAFMSAKAKVAAAFAKSAGAYSEAFAELDLNAKAAAEFAEKQAYSQALELEVKSLPGYEALSGLGVRMDMRYSLPEKNIDLALTPFFGAVDIAQVQMKIEDEMLYLGAPEVVGDAVFAVNTATLGQDLYAMGAAQEDAASLSINVFTVMQILEDYRLEIAQKQQIPVEQVEQILKTIEVEKVGKETVEVNGCSVKCTEYAVLIPQKALEDLLELAEKSSDPELTMEMTERLLEAVGAPEYVLEEMQYSMDDTQNAYDDIYDFLEETGDVECSVFVNKGYVMAITGELDAYGSTMEYEIQLGGGEHYVDNIGIYLDMDESLLTLESSGDHCAEKGVFTDETVIKVDGQKIVMESRFEPKADDENFELHMRVADSMRLDVVGLIKTEKDSVTLNLDQFRMTVDGESLDVAVKSTTSAYEEGNMVTDGAMEVLKMGEDELVAVFEDVAMDAMTWAEGFAADNAELMGILEQLMY